MSVVSGIWGAESSESASKDAAKKQADAEREKLAYLKEREAVPRYLSEHALAGLGGIYGFGPPEIEYGTDRYGREYELEGQEWKRELADAFGLTQGDLIERARTSPIYRQMVGSRDIGEEAILRNAGVTGGLRSGNVNENLYDYNIQLENSALLAAYNEQLAGLTGLAGLPSNANAIGNAMAAPGTTLAQGQVAGAQAIQQGYQNVGSNLLSMGQLGLSAYGSGLFGGGAVPAASVAGTAGANYAIQAAGAAGAVNTAASTAAQQAAGTWGIFSDRRLKENIEKITEIDGFNWYRWKWNSLANAIGLHGETMGCIADEVIEKRPDCVIMKDGFQFILYPRLNLSIFKEHYNA